MAFGDGINNPGNLTVTTDHILVYPGQSGSVSGPGGLTFATFPDQATGYNALQDYVSRHVTNGWGTLSQFTAGYLGTPNLQPNSANANPSGYLQTLENATGLGPNDPIQPSDYSNLTLGIAKAEGNSTPLSSLLGAFGFKSATPVPGVGSKVGGTLPFLQSFATQSFAARVVLVILGVILFGAAIVAFASQSKTVQAVTKSALKVAAA